MTKLDFFGLKLPFLDIFKKVEHSLFDAWSFLLIHIWLTPSEGSKDFINLLKKKLNHG